MSSTGDWWRPRTLGRSGLQVSRLGLGSSYGVGEQHVTRAIERGVNYLYWGAMRRDGFGRAIARAAKRDRERLCVVVQSYARAAVALGPSVDIALRRLGLEYADVLLLGWWNAPPPRRIVDRALALRDAGKVKTIMVSCHHRPSFAAFIADPAYGALMVRYNAAHRGAETDTFPHVTAALDRPDGAPGIVAYTATRWGGLVDPALVPPGEAVPRASDCYRFALSRPEVDVVLSWPRNGYELDEALAALDRGPMSEDELAWMRRVGDGVKAAAKTTSQTPRGRGGLVERAIAVSQRLGARLGIAPQD